jgi:hypothetical protein
MLAGVFVRVAGFGAVGLGLGALHFGTLRLNTGLYLAAGRRARAMGVHALRMALILAAWLVVARFGAVALVAAFGGLLVARWVVAARVFRVSARGEKSPGVSGAS